MNYQESVQILEKIKKAKRILINCHRSPDPDGVGSALALYLVLKKLGKNSDIICPDEISKESKFLPSVDIIKAVNFEIFDFSSYSLFLVIDSCNWSMVVGKKDIPKPNVPIVVIDHHITSDKFGFINLVDTSKTSAAEVLYLVFNDWKIGINKEIAQCLLAGIIADTGVFEYPGVTSSTLDIAKQLIEKGADKEKIVNNVYRNISFNQVRFWGEIIKNMQIDKKSKFVWSAVPFAVYESYGKPISGKETAASYFAQIIENTDFGMIMVEQENKVLSVSFRSKDNFDVSRIAEALGGGGHKAAAGAKVCGFAFDQAVEKVLQTARKFV